MAIDHRANWTGTELAETAQVPSPFCALLRNAPRFSLLLLVGGFAFVPTRAHAAGPLGDESEAIETSEYSVDPSRSVVQGSTRVIGLAGAFVGVAEGVEGNDYNAAAPAHRLLSSFSNVDVNSSVDFSLPSWLPGSNYYNSDEFESDESLGILSLATNVQWNMWGFGLTAGAERYSLTGQSQAGFRLERFRGNFGTLHLAFARSFADRDWSVGVGPIFKGVSFFGDNQSLFDALGVGAQAGLLYQPEGQPYRLGLNFKSPIVMDDLGANQRTATGDRVAVVDSEEVFIPNRLYEPWQLAAGAVWQFGPRPLNPQWVNPKAVQQRFMNQRKRQNRDFENEEAERRSRKEAKERARERAETWLRRRRRGMQKFGVLVSAQLTMYGPSRQAVGVRGLSEQTVRRTSETVTFSPRLGVESPVLPDRLRLRVGSYLEPTRFQSGRERMHATGGFDWKLFEWGVFGLLDARTGWTLTAAIDGARDYLNTSFGLSTWH